MTPRNNVVVLDNTPTTAFTERTHLLKDTKLSVLIVDGYLKIGNAALGFFHDFSQLGVENRKIGSILKIWLFFQLVQFRFEGQ